jgi:RNA polymerase sigma factor (sigma-70 family)
MMLAALFKNDKKESIELIKQVFQKSEYADVYDELRLLFIKSVRQFVKKKNGPYFAGYLYNCFKYAIKNLIENTRKDIMISNKMESLDDLNIRDYKYLENESRINQQYENFYLVEQEILNPIERSILYLHYGKRISIIRIAEMYGMERSSINIIKRKAKDKLINSGITLDDFEM